MHLSTTRLKTLSKNHHLLKKYILERLVGIDLPWFEDMKRDVFVSEITVKAYGLIDLVK